MRKQATTSHIALDTISETPPKILGEDASQTPHLAMCYVLPHTVTAPTTPCSSKPKICHSSSHSLNETLLLWVSSKHPWAKLNRVHTHCTRVGTIPVVINVIFDDTSQRPQHHISQVIKVHFVFSSLYHPPPSLNTGCVCMVDKC